MEGNGQVNDIVYKCDLTRPLPKKVYLGHTKREWQEIFQQDNTFKLHVALEKSFE